MSDRSVDDLLRDRRILVCVGTGGVGKTTVAAAIALEAARRGKRALVLTIDPARRLADALGIGALGNEPQELPEAVRGELSIEGDGRLYAMMLDMKRTFDELVTRFAESESARARILANPIYHHISDALAGSGEYAAMEKLYEMAESGRFDLIVLDTPPSQHGLDFLDAPRRLLEFLDSRMVKMWVHPAFSAGRFGFKLFQGAGQRAFKLIEKVSGMGFLEDVSEFLLAFEGMSSGFRDRAHRVQTVLRGAETGFVLVAGPSPEAARNGAELIRHLDEHDVSLRGVVVNRARMWPGDEPAPDGGSDIANDPRLATDLSRLASALEVAGAKDPELSARAAVQAAHEYAGVVALDAQSMRPLREQTRVRGIFFRTIPELPRDVHDLDGLSTIGQLLFRGDGPAHDVSHDSAGGK
jgi:anion-transporting  ArsA/GET3 family ATPase